MLVRDLMNIAPAVISPKATLADALALMAEYRTRHLVVVNAGSDVVGILSARDLALVYETENMTEGHWRDLLVKQVMSAKTVTIGSNAEIPEAAKLLLKKAVTALPVVDNGQLAGVLSDRDFTRHFATHG